MFIGMETMDANDREQVVKRKECEVVSMSAELVSMEHPKRQKIAFEPTTGSLRADEEREDEGEHYTKQKKICYGNESTTSICSESRNTQATHFYDRNLVIPMCNLSYNSSRKVSFSPVSHQLVYETNAVPSQVSGNEITCTETFKSQGENLFAVLSQLVENMKKR